MRKLTVAGLLALPELAGVRVLAGDQGLDRPVSGVNIVEVPEVAEWLSGGELLLSSGYPYRGNVNSLVSLVESLADIGVAALGYKPTGWLKSLPSRVLDRADGLDLPFLLLPEKLAYREVLEAVYVQLYSRGRSASGVSEFQALEADSNHDEAVESAVAGVAGHFGWSVELHDLVEHAVYRADADGEVVVDLDAGLTASPDRDADDDVSRMWLFAGDRHIGRLSAVGHNGAVDRLPAARAADHVERSILRRQAWLDGQRAAASMVYDMLLSGALAPEEAQDRAMLLGIGRGRTYAVARIEVPDVANLTMRPWQSTIDLHLREKAMVVATNPADRVLAMLVRGPDVDDALDQLELLLVHLADQLGANDPVVGASRVADDHDDLARVDRESRVALDAARRQGPGARVRLDMTSPTGLWLQVPDALARAFVLARVGPVEDAELLRTLRVYLDNNGNQTATASALPMHRSGLRYRLGKLEDLLGVDLSDAETCHELWLALQLRESLQARGVDPNAVD